MNMWRGPSEQMRSMHTVCQENNKQLTDIEMWWLRKYVRLHSHTKNGSEWSVYRHGESWRDNWRGDEGAGRKTHAELNVGDSGAGNTCRPRSPTRKRLMLVTRDHVRCHGCCAHCRRKWEHRETETSRWRRERETEIQRQMQTDREKEGRRQR